MQINRKSWLIRLASIAGHIEWYEKQISLCWLFWHCLAGLVVLIFWTIMVGGVLAGLAVDTYHHPWSALIILAFLASVVGLCFLGAWVTEKEVVKETFRGFKKRYCPIIDLVDKEDLV